MEAASPEQATFESRVLVAGIENHSNALFENVSGPSSMAPSGAHVDVVSLRHLADKINSQMSTALEELPQLFQGVRCRRPASLQKRREIKSFEWTCELAQ